MKPEGLSEFQWWWIRTRHPRTDRFFLYYLDGGDGEHQVINVCRRLGHASATLIWKTCHTCRRGVISKISMADDWQRQGLGRRLVLRAMRGAENYHWTTSGQSPMAQKFFPALSRETGAAFTPLSPVCEHIRAATRRFPKPRLDWSV
ncbi:GNAT family N-acetyltransferase [Streptomyces sp. NPDC001678]|uniref:GNAT family N-acetyltransferase n=1 Tax=Streptomyces sp. NPDC001678 TaxID=3364599 RepID=UPI0036997307